MKTLAIFLAVVGVACAQLGHQQHGHQQHAGHSTGGVQGGQAGAGAGAGGGPLGLLPKPINYGPKVFGQGHLNQWAIPPNPFVISRAVQIANSQPNVLVRLDLDGDVTLTNQYGQEVEAIGPFGQEIDLEF